MIWHPRGAATCGRPAGGEGESCGACNVIGSTTVGGDCDTVVDSEPGTGPCESDRCEADFCKAPVDQSEDGFCDGGAGFCNDFCDRGADFCDTDSSDRDVVDCGAVRCKAAVARLGAPLRCDFVWTDCWVSCCEVAVARLVWLEGCNPIAGLLERVRCSDRSVGRLRLGVGRVRMADCCEVSFTDVSALHGSR